MNFCDFVNLPKISSTAAQVPKLSVVPTIFSRRWPPRKRPITTVPIDDVVLFWKSTSNNYAYQMRRWTRHILWQWLSSSWTRIDIPSSRPAFPLSPLTMIWDISFFEQIFVTEKAKYPQRMELWMFETRIGDYAISQDGTARWTM
jgi:hypothetical protein